MFHSWSLLSALSLSGHRKGWVLTYVCLSTVTDGRQLAKASTMALVSMLVILLAVVVQGALAPMDLRGDLKGSLVLRPGIFQAIGVISFGEQ